MKAVDWYGAAWWLDHRTFEWMIGSSWPFVASNPRRCWCGPVSDDYRQRPTIMTGLGLHKRPGLLSKTSQIWANGHEEARPSFQKQSRLRKMNVWSGRGCSEYSTSVLWFVYHCPFSINCFCFIRRRRGCSHLENESDSSAKFSSYEITHFIVLILIAECRLVMVKSQKERSVWL